MCGIGQICLEYRRWWRAAKYDCRVVELVAVLCASKGRHTEFSAIVVQSRTPAAPSPQFVNAARGELQCCSAHEESFQMLQPFQV